MNCKFFRTINGIFAKPGKKVEKCVNYALDEINADLCLQTLEEGLEELEYFLG